MNFRRITSLLLCAVMISGTLLTGCQGKVTNENTDRGNEAESGNSFGDTIAKWDRNSEAARQRHMQELYNALQPMWNNEGKYPSAWDMTEFYADENAFMKDYSELTAWADSLVEYEGTLNNKESIYNYFHAVKDEEMNEKFNTMMMYCELGESLDMQDDYYKGLNDKLKELENRFAKATSFAQEEIMSIPYEDRIEIFEDPDFEDMAYFLSYYRNEEAAVFSKETKNTVADLVSKEGSGQDAYFNFRYVEMPAAEFTVNGKKLSLTDDVYTTVLQSLPDRQSRVDAYLAYTDNFKKYSDKYASFLQTSVSEKWKEAQAYGYDTTLEMKLAEDNLDEVIFTKVIEAARAAAPDYSRYIGLHKKALGYDNQYMFDLDTSVSDFSEPVFAYDATVDLLADAFSVLGNDYSDTFTEIVKGGNVDAQAGEYREQYSYTMAAGKVNSPHVFVNYYGEYADATNLAHEMGHAVNYKMVGKSQPIWYTEVSIFDTEVCSIMHELLFNAYMVKNAGSDEEKLFYLEKLLDLYDSAFFSQCMYSEFEDYLYKCVEGGGTLKGEDLNKKMAELFKAYRGDELEPEDSAWMGIDHLHYCYYMYKYATAISYASSIAGDILAGDKKVIDNYKEFMAAGSSAGPQEVLKIAGIDPLSDKTYKDAVAYYASLVDEYEGLLKSCKKTE